MGNARFGEQGGNLFVGFDRGGADEDRLALFVTGLHLFDESGELGVMVAIDVVIVVDTLNRPVGRNHDDLHVVDLLEFLFLGFGRTSHAREFLVETEEVLVGDGRHDDGLLLDLHAFFGLDGLLQAVVIFAALHDAAGELVDELDLVLGVHHVLDVAGHDVVGLKRLVDAMDEILVLGIVKVADAEHLFRFVVAVVGERGGFGLNVDGEVLLPTEHLHETIGDLVLAGGGFLAAGNDKRGAGFVDEDGVGFVDDAELQATEDATFHGGGHVVAEIVEAEFGVGGVSDIAKIRLALFGGGLGGEVDADGQTEEAIDLTHPFRVTGSEVLVDGDDMDAFTPKGVEVDGHGRG